MNLDRSEILQRLPHRPPILMIDEVVEIEPRVRGIGIRTFAEGDSCFSGHFPKLPIVPGALTIETFAQTAMAVFLAEESTSGMGYLAKVNKMTFLNKIVPGLTVRFAIEVTRSVGPFAYVSCLAEAEGGKYAQGELTLKIDD